MLKSVVEAYPDEDIRVLVVWMPMLESDNEEAAVKRSAMFKDPRVAQFWDPNRLAGIAYHRDVFPTAIKDAFAAATTDHPLYETLKSRADAKPEDQPFWDVAFLYKPGATWQGSPTKPDAWTKQVAYFGKQEDGASAYFFRNDYTKPPVTSDWVEELSLLMKSLMGRDPAARP